MLMLWSFERYHLLGGWETSLGTVYCLQLKGANLVQVTQLFYQPLHLYKFIKFTH